MQRHHGDTYRAVSLGGLGTGTVDFCDDGRFRFLTINGNGGTGRAIPLAPHSFLAVRAAGAEETYVRRLQTVLAGQPDLYTLPSGWLHFRGLYPQADCQVDDPAAPVETTFGLYAPVIPYDYEASALPVVFIAVQVTNVSEEPLQVSAAVNWQNTSGYVDAETPDATSPIARHVIVAEDDWERAKHNESGDNERRLRAGGEIVTGGRDKSFYQGDIPPNALLFGDAGDTGQPMGAQYCLVARWEDGLAISHRAWDPEQPAERDSFWEEFAGAGRLADPSPDGDSPRCGSLCVSFDLAPGEARRAEFVLSWYAHGVPDGDEGGGHYYANAYPDALAVARTALRNSAYYYTSVDAWRKRCSSMGYPKRLSRQLIDAAEVLSTNSRHTYSGAFGMMQSQHDPRVNNLRDRWYWSLILLLFYPRLESEALERIAGFLLCDDGSNLAASEDLDRLAAAEFVGPGAGQVDIGAGFVLCVYRNYLLGGNLPAVNDLAPAIQRVMARLLALDKDLDGFPDIQDEGRQLDGPFASGLNVITAGIWLVALYACESLVSMRRLKRTAVYTRARERAAENFERYFWDDDGGYYRLYPLKSGDGDALDGVCHIGQLTPIWMADLLALGEIFPEAQVVRAIDAITKNHLKNDRLPLLTRPCGPEPGTGRPWEAGHPYDTLAYVCVRRYREPFAHVYRDAEALLASWRAPGSERYDVCQLAPWYLLLADFAVCLHLAHKRLVLRPTDQHVGSGRAHTLLTPRGFGHVHLSVQWSPEFACRIEFDMDVPVELKTILVHIERDPGDVAGTFELPDGPMPARIERGGADSNGGVVLEVVPSVKTSTSTFELELVAPGELEAPDVSRKQWLPHWLRRDRA